MSDRLTAATKVIEEWIDRGYGNPEDNADSAARALDEAGLLAPDDDLLDQMADDNRITAAQMTWAAPGAKGREHAYNRAAEIIRETLGVVNE